MSTTPHVVTFESLELSMTEPLALFERSRFANFYNDGEERVQVGLWEVERGQEQVPGSFDPHGFPRVKEVLVVVDGQFFTRLDGEAEEQVVGPGQCIVLLPDRNTHVRVEERSRAVYFIWGADVEALANMHQTADSA